MKIVDSHCHAWTYWPYTPPVPDPEHRGRIEQLLHEMDGNGVSEAVIICAQIEHNPENNAYIVQQAAQHGEHIHPFADIDSLWSPTYHQPGAADRLRQIADRWPIKGFTHYLAADDQGEWLWSPEGNAFFGTAAELGLIASIACRPHQQPAIRKVAEQFPEMPILIHHLGMVSADEGSPHAGLKQVLDSARLPNIYIKLSGFAYAAQRKYDYPYSDVHWLVRAEYEHFGPHRMCWGSDYPVVRFFMTYRQALEAFRTHCSFVPDADKEQILGGTLDRLLSQAGKR